MKKYRILTTKTDPKVTMRLPKEVFDALEAIANFKERSFNTQLVISLIDSLEAIEKAQKQASAKNGYTGTELMNMIMHGKAADFKAARQQF